MNTEVIKRRNTNGFIFPLLALQIKNVLAYVQEEMIHNQQSKNNVSNSFIISFKDILKKTTAVVMYYFYVKLYVTPFLKSNIKIYMLFKYSFNRIEYSLLKYFIFKWHTYYTRYRAYSYISTHICNV